MSIVLDEYDWTEKMILNHSLGTKPIETLNRVSKYYYYEKQYKKTEIRKMLDTFLIQCDPTASLIHWSDSLDRITKNVNKYPLIQLDGVSISKIELEYIDNIKGIQLQRLAFTLLCVSKYWDYIYPTNNHWVNTSDREIMKMANVDTSVKRQSLLFSKLRDMGFIKFSKKIDNLNVQVIINASDVDEEALFISDFRNLGYQYMKHAGAPFFDCQNCGITTKIQNPASGRKPKYCPNCAIELHTKQRVNSVMQNRSRFLN